MILEHLPLLNQKQIVLASASPRRAELLRQVGLSAFKIIPSQFAEGLEKDAYGGPAGYAKQTARCKALDVAATLEREGRIPELIIGADTVVDIDGSVLEKPSCPEMAFNMLRRMSGRQHYVHTGVTLIVPSSQDCADSPQQCLSSDGFLDTGTEQRVHSSASTTLVEFDDLSDAAIQAYIATGEPFDKAGSYGAQGPAGLWIKRIEGCYFNVMGLPLHDLALNIKHLIDSGQI